jgi:hypothetical protein
MAEERSSPSWLSIINDLAALVVYDEEDEEATRQAQGLHPWEPTAEEVRRRHAEERKHAPARQLSREDRTKARQKRVEWVKTHSPEYKRYIEAVPKERRVPRRHPTTPRAEAERSKRSFEGEVAAWRAKLWELDAERQVSELLRSPHAPSRDPDDW